MSDLFYLLPVLGAFAWIAGYIITRRRRLKADAAFHKSFERMTSPPRNHFD